jgi:hypothetical protein
MINRAANDTTPMYLDTFLNRINTLRPFRDDEYLTMCMNMSDEDELPFSEGSQELKDAMIAARDLIIGYPKRGVLNLIKHVRTKDNIPRSHFWWYIDEL